MEAGARDLLRRFSGGFSADEVAGGDSDEIELGLSLGGCFSSQNSENCRLVRSSSIPTALPSEFPPVVPLVRACSLPSETEEDVRRRREMQSIKRMEAKRKREEKRNSKRCEEDFEGGSVGKMRRLEHEQNGVLSSLRSFLPASQGSVVSQGSSSSGSGGSELESRLGHGSEVHGSKNISNVAITELNSQKSTPPSSTLRTSTPKSINGAERSNGKGEAEANMIENMPSVSTRGDGPNGRRIEGFLYRYRRGEEVSIVCVCHGSFLTPAEFVKHAGGGDVAHPLRHIVVNPSPGIFS